MATILDKIIAAKREELVARMHAAPLADQRAQAAGQPPALDFTGALRGARPRGSAAADANVIAEIKRRSPSKGVFPWHGDVARQARAYDAGGAAAISVVTDGPFFGGDEAMLQSVKATVRRPVLQKEFLVEPWQVWHARAIGADAALLIAAVLPGAQLADLLGTAREAGLHILVEIVDEDEYARANAAGAEVIGVNNRDLRDFSVDLGRTERLLPLYAEGQVAVAESGLQGRAEIERLQAAGVDAFLMGEALMLAPDPAAHLHALRGLAPSAAAAPAAKGGQQDQDPREAPGRQRPGSP